MPYRRELADWLATYGWPGAGALAALVLALWGWLAGNGFIDGVVHDSELKQLRIQNEADHGVFKKDIEEIKDGVDRIITSQRRQGEAISRIEASRK